MQTKEQLQKELSHIYSLIKAGAKPTKLAQRAAELKKQISAMHRKRETPLQNHTNTFKTEVEKNLHQHRIMKALRTGENFILKSSLLPTILVNSRGKNIFEYYTTQGNLVRGTFSIIGFDIHFMFPPHSPSDFWEVFTLHVTEVKIRK